ncbi:MULTISPECIES: branched-chain amino acid ABC transporter permease [unclassified Chelatococcus]|uniref:branched-chain amino acid ABC transporter permease n=1 Tax=unclassified Chelatococcus TaxID=2638111 RepID=UPI0020C02ACE|nr:MULTISPECIES: branched-chain amino acid ABC transporter permease [unclassified Chelatococcus]MCO5075463.1 branched-chain amino acid ABC transporter permease [Chelatococcus sp.]
MSRQHMIYFGVLLALLTVAPFVLYPLFVMKIICFALLACSLNLLLGYGGLLSFGHAAYFGASSYITAWTARDLGLTPELAIACGVGASALLALVFGALAIRRQGIYFAMITLAFAQLVYFASLRAPFTGGEDGIQGVPRGNLLSLIPLASDRGMYCFVAVVFFLALLLMHRIIHSPFGQVMKSIRENEPRAISLGYHVNSYKLRLFIFSAAFAGLAGGMKSLVFSVATLNDVYWEMSGEAVLMTLLGGAGTFFGPILGAAVIVTLQNQLAALGAWITIIQGTLFVLCVMLLRGGLVGLFSKMAKFFR